MEIFGLNVGERTGHDPRPLTPDEKFVIRRFCRMTNMNLHALAECVEVGHATLYRGLSGHSLRETTIHHIFTEMSDEDMLP